MTNFLQACVAVVRLQVEQFNASDSTLDRRHLRRMISVTIRNLTDHPDFKISMSQAAKALAEERGIPLEKMTYDNQKRWDKGRLLFAYEHMVPVKNLMNACIAEPHRIYDILQTTKIVWVTRDEDDKLTALGYSHNRPQPTKCYQEAGIMLL